MKENEILLDLRPPLYDRTKGRFCKGMFSLLMTKKDIHEQTKGWKFKWIDEIKKGYDIYGLVLETGELQGLIALKLQEGFVEVSLAEASPHNIGSKGRYELVGPNLFAIASLISFYAGFEGFICFDAKSNLVSHYKKRYSATAITDRRMYLDCEAATILIVKCFGQGVLNSGDY